MELAIEIGVAFLLILLNGLFALSEMAMVSVRRARLMVLERKGVTGATAALNLSDDPQRFLPTVQVGMTLVGILTGTFGGARLAGRLEPVLARSSVHGAVRRRVVAADRGAGQHLPHARAGRAGAQATGPAATGDRRGPDRPAAAAAQPRWQGR